MEIDLEPWHNSHGKMAVRSFTLVKGPDQECRIMIEVLGDMEDFELILTDDDGFAIMDDPTRNIAYSSLRPRSPGITGAEFLSSMNRKYWPTTNAKNDRTKHKVKRCKHKRRTFKNT